MRWVRLLTHSNRFAFYINTCFGYNNTLISGTHAPCSKRPVPSHMSLNYMIHMYLCVPSSTIAVLVIKICGCPPQSAARPVRIA
ncbi:hypothetical protein M430DRAFT_181370 [Amorphotheca resinae ATCC 22711]|uniref:Uncharacterized protein n=1 Tax=Amorphotheca resinae ATCC 22711 TaxID=857342 RepID=A0A2T3ARF9_AMORE|nr:hypothetical protein M430DRAFT_181370 [Amorphotheca resinae ATCC 22711]PSS08959.1 hypothetical protein M430DRAFT_181370 [Amorphotheca resinae ATCC 22711]